MPRFLTLISILFLAHVAARADQQAMVLDWNLEPLRCRMPDLNYRFVGTSSPGQLFYRDESVNLRLFVRKQSTDTAAENFNVEIQAIHTRRPNKYEKAYIEPFGHPDRITLDGPPVIHPIRINFGDTNQVEFELKDLPVPKRYGTYALILTRGEEWRQFLGTVARIRQTPSNTTVESTPIFADGSFFESPTLYQQHAAILARMGIRGIRVDASWKESADGAYDWDEYDQLFSAAEANRVKVMLTLGAHPPHFLPFKQPTPAANWKGNFSNETTDWLCDPALYPRYAKWIEALCQRYWKDGKGALWALEHYNQPWEGGSASGWARDCLQYRELLKVIATAAKKVDPRIKIAGASSIMNTEDKLFSDGTREFAQFIDIFTDYYARPPAAYGPMVAASHGKESMDAKAWVVISEYLLPVTVCRVLATGQKRVVPWHPRVLFDSLPGTDQPYFIPTTIPVATAAFNALVAGRPFEKIVFRSHLPWLFQFGTEDDPDGVLVLFGQMLSSGAGTSTQFDRNRIWRQVDSAEGGHITIDNRDGLLRFFDLAGNPVHEGRKFITFPMDYLPTYIKCDGGPKAAIKRIAQAKIEGKRPVEILPNDFTSVLAPGAPLAVDIHNCLNAPVQGTLAIRPPEGITLITNSVAVTLEAGETKRLYFTLASVAPMPSNSYLFHFDFSSDAGRATYSELLNQTTAFKGTKQVDGNLEDWAEVTGIVRGGIRGLGDPHERMRRSWEDWERAEPGSPFAELKLAWDDQFIYVAARVNDPTPDMDHPRMATRDDDEFFHSASSDQVEPYKSFLQENPAAYSFAQVPYVYRKVPHETAYQGDRLQIAFDLTPGWHDLKPTTNQVPAGFHAIPDTDYEFSLYLCEDGESELWRLLAPGVPRIHDWPRQPKGAITTGPVSGAKHVVLQKGALRIYEAAIPRDAIPDLNLSAGTPFKFTFRVGNDEGADIHYGQAKAVTKENSLTLHPYWEVSPSCSIQWRLIDAPQPKREQGQRQEANGNLQTTPNPSR